MKSNLRLVLFGLLGLIALSAVLAEPEEESLSQDLAAAARVARSPVKGRNKMGKKKKGNYGKPRNGVKGRRRGNRKAMGNKRKAKGGNVGKGRKRGKGQRRGSKKARNQWSKKAETRTTVSSTCFESAVSYMKMWKDVVSNFGRQVNRMTKQNKTGSNKSGKKGAFAPTGHRLVDIGGGNRSNLSCGGNYNNSGAKQLKNLTDTLFDCEITVNASCNPANIPQPNFTLLAACQKLMDSFTKEATTCLNKTTGKGKTNNVDACTCWSSSTLSQTAAKLKHCKANNESKAITAALKNCTTAFQKCRKFEDAAGKAISSCASDSSKLIKKAANLAANSASMTAAKTKMSSLSTSSGKKLVVRATAAASCADVISISKKISKISMTFPQSPMITTYAKKISSSTVTCTTEQKTSLIAEVTAMETAIARVKSVLATIQEEIQTLTGSTASTTQLDAENAATSTAAPAGRRDRMRRLLYV